MEACFFEDYEVGLFKARGAWVANRLGARRRSEVRGRVFFLRSTGERRCCYAS